MTMIQPAPILPSNAPLRDDGTGFAATTGYDQYAYHQSHGVKNENPMTSVAGVYPQYSQIQPPRQQYYQPHRPYRPAYRYGFPRSRYCYQTKAEHDRHIEETANALWERFYRSEQYAKYRARQTGKGDDKGNQDQKWPDKMEKAFFQALVRWTPMGRRKQLHKDKQRGRNELIADYIEELTGESRTRKQVSSHIQVLKPFVLEDPVIMRYLSKDDLTGHPRHRGPHASYYGGMNRHSRYSAVAPAVSGDATVPGSQQVIKEQVKKWKTSAGTLEPNEFSMFIQRLMPKRDEQGNVIRDENGQMIVAGPPERLHTYTRSPENAQNPLISVCDYERMAQAYEFLGSMHRKNPIDCNIVLAEASFALPTSDFAEYGELRELGILFTCATSELPLGTVLKSRTHFYERNEDRQKSWIESHEDETAVSRAAESEMHAFQLRFGSKFWARILGRMTKDVISTSADRDQIKQEVSTKLQSIQAYQELFMTVEHGDQRVAYERIAVIYWKFRLSSMPKGKTTWARLVVQPSQAEVTEQQPPNKERNDSFVDFNTPLPVVDPNVSQASIAVAQPVLQSPFEYDSGPTSALSTGTWPTHISDSAYGSQTQQTVQTEFGHTEPSFDFNGAHINMTYDTGSLNLDNFDSAAFNFDAGADFSADPALEQYSQQWFENEQAQAYNNTQSQSFEHAAQPAAYDNTQSQQTYDHAQTHQPYERAVHHAYTGARHQPAYAVTHGMSMPTEHTYAGAAQTDHHAHPQAYGVYEHHYDPNLYGVGHTEQQAYGGATQEGLNQDALTALADASFIASLAPRQE